MILNRAQIAEIQDKIGIVFRDPILLERAFVHRSYLNETPKSYLRNYERLEFLGDRVVGLSLAQCLYKKLPDVSEGQMTAIFCFMANHKTFAQIMEKLELGKFILMSRGERKEFELGGQSSKIIMCDVFEALVAAIYLDRGMGVTELFLDNVLLSMLGKVISERRYIEAKSYLQELVADRLKLDPQYKTLEQTGPDHEKIFTVGVYWDGQCMGKGSGRSKGDAGNMAAVDALKSKFQIVLNQAE